LGLREQKPNATSSQRSKERWGALFVKSDRKLSLKKGFYSTILGVGNETKPEKPEGGGKSQTNQSHLTPGI